MKVALTGGASGIGAAVGRLLAAVDRAGITYMQSYPKRFDPVNHELKRLIDDGELFERAVDPSFDLDQDFEFTRGQGKSVLRVTTGSRFMP